MFKYYLYLNNEVTFEGQYELHKKNCPIVRQLKDDGDDSLIELGFFSKPCEAMAAAKEALAERALDPAKANGCLACCKEFHER